MPWAEQWSYLVDGTNVNDHINYVCQIPEIDNMQNQDVILAQIAGDHPVFIRSQPAEGRLTFNVALKGAGPPATYRTRMDALAALFAQGTRHTLTVQARGMGAAKTLRFYVEGTMVDYTRRLLSVRAVAPKPVLE
jgi:hypothetical protein